MCTTLVWSHCLHPVGATLFSIWKRFEHKIAVLCHTCIFTSASKNACDVISICKPGKTLRSSLNKYLLNIPKVRTSSSERHLMQLQSSKHLEWFTSRVSDLFHSFNKGLKLAFLNRCSSEVLIKTSVYLIHVHFYSKYRNNVTCNIFLSIWFCIIHLIPPLSWVTSLKPAVDLWYVGSCFMMRKVLSVFHIVPCTCIACDVLLGCILWAISYWAIWNKDYLSKMPISTTLKQYSLHWN